MPTEELIIKALENLYGPGGKSLSRAVSGIMLSGKKAFVSLSGDPEKKDAWELARRNAEKAILSLPDIEQAVVTLTAEHAGTAQKATHDHHHSNKHDVAPNSPQAPNNRSLHESLKNIKHIVAVASGKGGVGKSTTAANLSLALAAQGWRVGLLDADIYGPSIPRLFGVNQKPAVDSKKLTPIVACGIKLMSMGFLVDENTPMVWRGPMVTQALTQMLSEVSWGSLDALIVDMPPGTGDIQLTLAQQVPLAGAVIVTTPQDLALIDARRAIAMFRKVHAPILGLIENMSYFLCPHCNGRSDIFSHGGARHDAEKYGVPFLGEAPLDMRIRETSDLGSPIVFSDPHSSQSGVFLNLAAKIKTLLETEIKKAPPNIILS